MDLMVTAEVSEMTRTPEATLRYFRQCGTGPASFKLGRRVVYRREAVISWLASQEQADPSSRTA